MMNFHEVNRQLDELEADVDRGNYSLPKERALSILAELENSDFDEQLEHQSDILQGREFIKVKTILLLANIEGFREENSSESLKSALAALSIAEQFNFSTLVPIALKIIGSLYSNLKINDLAIEYFEKAILLYQKSDDQLMITRIRMNMGNVYKSMEEYDTALEYYYRALSSFELLGKKRFAAGTKVNIGDIYFELDLKEKALEYYGDGLVLLEEIDEKPYRANVLNLIGRMFFELGNYDNSLEYHTNALALHEEMNDKLNCAHSLNDLGCVHSEFGDYDKSLECYGKALVLNQELEQREGIAIAICNIGYIYRLLGNYDKSLEYQGKALVLFEELSLRSSFVDVKGEIGIIHSMKDFDGYNASIAEEYIKEAIAMIDEPGEKHKKYGFHAKIAVLYEQEERWKEAYYHKTMFDTIQKEVLNQESKNAAIKLVRRQQVAEREKKIAIAKATSDAKYQATEELLHNVLPPSIAHRILGGEKVIAEKLSNVSVLFADIVNFTKLSQRITPEELVEGLDRIFSAFDALAEKHGLEKIKTIGDAYMVVSGAPIQRKDHAEAMAHFALDMVEAMKEFRSISTGEEIQLRIGIHSGEVVAGVIGKKKFAYDLWGDAVNTSSRMESHGEPGKIHVSEEFLKKLLMVNGEWLIDVADDLSSFTINHLPLTIIPRGEMEIKGKGTMKTYFLEATP